VCSPVKKVERKPLSHVLLCYVTDRNQFTGSEQDRQQRLLAKIAECGAAGVDYIQLREKDLGGGELEKLARQAMDVLPASSPTRLLINSRVDVALAAGAHGVHLPANDLQPSDVRGIMMRAGVRRPIIGASAHSIEEVAIAESHGADFVAFAPVFEKDAQPNPAGLARLHAVCRRINAADPPMPVLALGGVTAENAQKCVAAGAAGIAGIRVFQENAAAPLVEQLRSLVAR